MALLSIVWTGLILSFILVVFFILTQERNKKSKIIKGDKVLLGSRETLSILAISMIFSSFMLGNFGSVVYLLAMLVIGACLVPVARSFLKDQKPTWFLILVLVINCGLTLFFFQKELAKQWIILTNAILHIGILFILIQSSGDETVKKRGWITVFLGLLLFIMELYSLTMIETLSDFLRLFYAYFVYTTIADASEQYLYQEPIRKWHQISKPSVILGFILSAVLLTTSLTVWKQTTYNSGTVVYQSQNEHFYNLYLVDQRSWNYNLAYPMSEEYRGTTYDLKIMDTQRKVIYLNDTGDLDDGTYSAGSYWIISSVYRKEEGKIPIEDVIVEFTIKRGQKIIDHQTLLLSPTAIPSFKGSGKYFTVNHIEAGYGYFSGADIDVNNTLQINILKHRNLCTETIFYDENGNVSTSGSSKGTMGFGTRISFSDRSNGFNYENVGAVRGEIKIWVEDKEGQRFFEETIPLELKR